VARPGAGWLWSLAALGVAAGGVALGWRRVWLLSPDAVNYAGAAHAFAEGRGLVAPVQYSYFLAGATPPLPAIHVFAPVFPLLLAAPFALGADLPQAFAAHVVFASLVGAAALAVGRRCLAPASALAFALAVAWSPAWVAASRQLLTEASAGGVLLAFLGVAGRCLLGARESPVPARESPVPARESPATVAARSVARALALGALAWIGWLTRPNLALLLPAALLAATLELSPRRALRSRPLWACALAFTALVLATELAVRAATGRAPYAHYAILSQLFEPREARLFRAEYPGALAFFRAHAAEVAALWLAAARSLARALCLGPDYHYVGWLALPGLVHACAGGGRGRFERRLAAFAALGFLVSAVATGSSFAPRRYPLPAAVCLWLVALAAVEDAGRWLARRARDPGAAWARALPGALPLGCALAAIAAASVALGPGRFAGASALGRRGSVHAGGSFGRSARAFCAEVPRDAIVAAIDPWTFHLWCGNASLWVPTDLDGETWVARYLDALRPTYLVLDATPPFAALRASPRLERIAESGPHALYRVRGAAADSPRWDAPPPLARR